MRVTLSLVLLYRGPTSRRILRTGDLSRFAILPQIKVLTIVYIMYILRTYMNTAVINIKTDIKMKAMAQRVASQLGFSLSSLINAYLRDLVRSKSVHFTLKEEPSEYLLRVLEASEKNRQAGRVSPRFKTAKEAITWLKRKNRFDAGTVQSAIPKAVR